MALEQVKLQGTSSVTNTESTPKASTNSFNTSLGNLFIKEQNFNIPQKDSKTPIQKSATGNLFGSGVVQETETKPQAQAAQQQKTGGLDVISKYFKNILPTFKEAGDKVNQYNAAVDNALKLSLIHI